MNKRTLFVVLFAMLCLALSAMTVLADQDGGDRWCNMDQYGCWVTGDEGEQIYISFWTEEARKYFMGDITAPYTNVIDRCVDCEDGKLPLSRYYGWNGVGGWNPGYWASFYCVDGNYHYEFYTSPYYTYKYVTCDEWL